MFSHLSTSRFSCTYRSASDLLIQDLSVTFLEGWTGVVGANGSGKTTLLRLLAGEDLAGACSISGIVRAKGSVTLCPQEIATPPKQLVEFWECHDRYAWKLRDNLNLTEIAPEQWEAQSPGEQKRIQIAVALWLQPQILLLDEPTNHLDVESKCLLVSELKRFNGIGLVVSHDRTLLDTLCQNVLWLRHCRSELIPGGYTAADATMRLRMKSQDRAHEDARREQLRLEREWKRRIRVADDYASARSKRSLDRQDSDSRARIDGAIVSGKDAAQNRIKKQMEHRVRQATAEVEALANPRKFQTGVLYSLHEQVPKVVLYINDQDLPLPNGKVVRVPNLTIHRGDRIGIVGRNGVGKSTLLALVANLLQRGTRSMAHLPQEFSEEACTVMREDVPRTDSERRGRLMATVRRLGSDPELVLASRSLSFGEARKLWIAKSLEEAKPIMLLDEPTNHLDLVGIESIEEALLAYQGTLVIVSHDERLMERLVSRVWQLRDGEVCEPISTRSVPQKSEGRGIPKEQ